MRTTTRGIHRRLSFLPTSSALTVGLALASAGQARAQAQPAPDPATQPTDTAPTGAQPSAAQPPPQALAESNPLVEQQLDQVRKMVSSMPKLIEPNGYFRSGTGINSKGGAQEAFGIQPNGALPKYRLGNETEMYGEFGITVNWIRPDQTDEAWFKTVFKVAFVAPRLGTFDVANPIAVRETYGQTGHVIDSKPEMSFWAGQRFYRRKDVHINDFFHQDTSGYGAGFEDLKLGEKAKLAVAYLGSSSAVAPAAGGGFDLGRLYKSTLDLRVYDIPVGSGTLELWLLPTVAAEGNSGMGNRSGIGGGAFYNIPFMGGFNEIGVEYGYAGSANLASDIDLGLAKDGFLFRVVDRATVQVNPKLSMMWTGILQLENKNGDSGASTDSGAGNMWISAGARPVYCFTKHLGIAVEGGVDVLKKEQDGAKTGVLGKLTVAGLIRPGTDFWARPELRAFVTTAFWNDALKGVVGGAAYATDTVGLTTGVQAEVWW